VELACNCHIKEAIEYEVKKIQWTRATQTSFLAFRGRKMWYTSFFLGISGEKNVAVVLGKDKL